MALEPQVATFNRFIVLCPWCDDHQQKTPLFAREGTTAFIYGREHQYTQVGGVLVVICQRCKHRHMTDLDKPM